MANWRANAFNFATRSGVTATTPPWLSRLMPAGLPEPMSLRRRSEPLTPASIRTQLDTLKRQATALTAERDGLALDAVRDASAEARYVRLDATIGDTERRIAVLERALPQALELERAAAEQAETERRNC